MFNTSSYYAYGIQKFELTSIAPAEGSNIYYRSSATFTLTFNQNIHCIDPIAGFTCELHYTGGLISYADVTMSLVGNSFSVTFSPPTGSPGHPLGAATLQLPANTLYGNINNHFLTNLTFNYNVTNVSLI